MVLRGKPGLALIRFEQLGPGVHLFLLLFFSFSIFLTCINHFSNLGLINFL